MKEKKDKQKLDPQQIMEKKEKRRKGWEKVKRVFQIIGKVLYHSRKVFLTVPVVLAALKIYEIAKERLPENVGVFLQDDGVFKYMFPMNKALMYCFAATGICLLMMYCSRKTIYPWVISLFTLVLPLLLIITNMYPA